tara:strand:+ start:1189 stop:1920 length:732 start_codon:yes stop_codon:yes gene_type:complete
MPTYKRNIFLSDINHPVLNVASHPLVSKVIIIWQNIGEEVPDSIFNNLKNIGIYRKVKFKYPTKNSLNNRFCLYDTGQCVLSIDDDYIITNEALEKCFEVWLNNKRSIVGIVPRYMDEYEYSGSAADIGSVYRYNLILTGGAMFDNKMLSIYNNDTDNLKLVDEIFNGEDIMFNFIHSYHFKAVPIYIHDDRVKTWKRIKGNSVSETSGGSKGHMLKRRQVYQYMKNKYGDVLTTTSEKYFAR